MFSTSQSETIENSPEAKFQVREVSFKWDYHSIQFKFTSFLRYFEMKIKNEVIFVRKFENSMKRHHHFRNLSIASSHYSQNLNSTWNSTNQYNQSQDSTNIKPRFRHLKWKNSPEIRTRGLSRLLLTNYEHVSREEILQKSSKHASIIPGPSGAITKNRGRRIYRR